jgi:hypothetical protein
MTRFKEILPKVLPTGAALLLFFIVSALYFAPQFRGEVLPQHDVQQYEGMAKEIWKPTPTLTIYPPPPG